MRGDPDGTIFGIVDFIFPPISRAVTVPDYNPQNFKVHYYVEESRNCNTESNFSRFCLFHWLAVTQGNREWENVVCDISTVHII